MRPGLSRKQIVLIGGLIVAVLIVEGAVAFVASRLDARARRSRSPVSFRVPAGSEGFFLVPRARGGTCDGPLVVTVPPTGRCAPLPECAGPIGKCYDTSGRRIPTWFEDEEFRGYNWENEVGIRPVDMDNNFALGEVYYLGSEKGFRRTFPGWGHEIPFGLVSKGGSHATQP